MSELDARIKELDELIKENGVELGKEPADRMASYVDIMNMSKRIYSMAELMIKEFPQVAVVPKEGINSIDMLNIRNNLRNAYPLLAEICKIIMPYVSIEESQPAPNKGDSRMVI